MSVNKLRLLDGSDIIFCSVDKHCKERCVNSVANEDDDLRAEGDLDKSYYDDKDKTRSLLSGMPSPPVVRLKVGAKVLCTHRIDGDVRVGCMGVVLAFRDAADSTLDCLLSSHNMGCGTCAQTVREDWGCVHPDRSWPQVEFNVHGKLFMRTVHPEVMNLEDNLGTVICSRVQLLLILAYSLTVHRAQAMTLDAVSFNLAGLFAEGQLYTALSRVRDFDKLRVTGKLMSGCKCANKKVLAFEANTRWRLIDNGPEEGGAQGDGVVDVVDLV